MLIIGLRSQCPPVSLHVKFQRESNKPYILPTPVTWLQLLRKQASTGTSTALTAETLIYAHTTSCILPIVTSTQAR